MWLSFRPAHFLYVDMLLVLFFRSLIWSASVSRFHTNFYFFFSLVLLQPNFSIFVALFGFAFPFVILVKHKKCCTELYCTRATGKSGLEKEVSAPRLHPTQMNCRCTSESYSCGTFWAYAFTVPVCILHLTFCNARGFA